MTELTERQSAALERAQARQQAIARAQGSTSAALYSPANAGMFPQASDSPSVDVLDPVQGNTGALGIMEAIGDNVIGLDNGVMSPGEKLGTLLNMGGEGLTFGVVGDEASAGLSSMMGGNYDRSLAEYRANEAQVREENPVLSFGAEVLPAMAIPAGTMLRGGSLASRALKGGATAAAGGGLYGFMEGEGGSDNRLGSARDTATIAGLLGLGLPIAGAAAVRGVDALKQNRAIREAVKMAPSQAELRDLAGRIYDRAEQVVNLPRSQFAQVAANTSANAARSGADDMLTPTASRVLRNMDEIATDPNPNMSFRELDILRRQAGIPAGDIANPTQARIGSQVAEAVDDFVESVDPALADEIADAREMWGRMRRNETISAAIERAENQASGFENGLRVQFRALLNNKKALRGFSEAEVRAMRQVVNGTKFGNLMRQVGRAGISLDGGSNAMGAMVSGGLGGAAFGPLGLAIPVVGTAARKLGEMSTRRSAQTLQDVVASGATANVRQIAPQVETTLAEYLARAGRGIGAAAVEGDMAPSILVGP